MTLDFWTYKKELEGLKGKVEAFKKKKIRNMTFYLNVCIQLDLEAYGLSIPVKNLDLFFNAFVSNAMHVFPTL